MIKTETLLIGTKREIVNEILSEPTIQELQNMSISNQLDAISNSTKTKMGRVFYLKRISQTGLKLDSQAVDYHDEEYLQTLLNNTMTSLLEYKGNK